MPMEASYIIKKDQAERISDGHVSEEEQLAKGC